MVGGFKDHLGHRAVAADCSDILARVGTQCGEAIGQTDGIIASAGYRAFVGEAHIKEKIHSVPVGRGKTGAAKKPKSLIALGVVLRIFTEQHLIEHQIIARIAGRG